MSNNYIILPRFTQSSLVFNMVWYFDPPKGKTVWTKMLTSVTMMPFCSWGSTKYRGGVNIASLVNGVQWSLFENILLRLFDKVLVDWYSYSFWSVIKCIY